MSIKTGLRILFAAIGVAACGGDNDNETTNAGGGLIQIKHDNSGVQITVGSKNFTEEYILGEIYAQGLEAAGYDVKTDLNLGSEVVALRALKADEIDGYPEYTATALTSFFGEKPEDVPSDAQKAYEQSKAEFAKEGLVAFPPAPFADSNAVGTLTSTAEKLGLQNVSDLEGKSQDLTLYGSPECRQRADCLLGLQKVYGLQFKKFVPVDIALRHEVLTKGQADLSIVFTTDPQIKREGFVLLEDDKGMFPPYNSTFVVRDETAKQAGPDLAKVVAQVEEGLTNETMQELNARVDLDKKTPEQVAKEYLQESGLVE